MQLFLATTADGQQLLLQAPAGTDPASLIAPDGSVQGCYLATATVLPSALRAGGQQQQLGAAVSPSKAPGLRPARRPELSVDTAAAAVAPPGSALLSPDASRPREPASLFRCSPGKTVFGPASTSRGKPALGFSPSKPPRGV